MKRWLNQRLWVLALLGGLQSLSGPALSNPAQESAAPSPSHSSSAPRPAPVPTNITVASKTFTESVILGEVLRLTATHYGHHVTHQRQLGGTRIVWNALGNGEIDAYVEYTGTLQQEILQRQDALSIEALRDILHPMGLGVSDAFGFNNTYALGMPRTLAQQRGIQTVSDLAAHPDLRLGFSHEFLDRPDGWPGLSRYYQLPHQRITGLEHELAYRALESGDIQVTDMYTTDAEIPYYDLQALADDRSFFPTYEAIILYRLELSQRAPRVVEIWLKLGGTLDAVTMSRMNAAVKLEDRPDAAVAAEYLAAQPGLAGIGALLDTTRGWRLTVAQISARTVEHLRLVGISLLLAVVFALPLGISAAKWPRLGRWLLSATSILQTIPSLALFVFLIPLLGIGAAPAIAALFFYSLLPIVRNSHAGISQIPRALQDSARALGLTPWYRLWRIELPLATPTIIAGIQTAAVINVGTATLAALIGAGGYGQPILTGIRLDDLRLIMQGAIPAALLAVLVQAAFNGIERLLVPAALRHQHEAT